MDKLKSRKVIGAIVALLVALELIGESQGVGIVTAICNAVSCV